MNNYWSFAFNNTNVPALKSYFNLTLYLVVIGGYLAMLGFKELETGVHIRPDNIEDNILMVRKRLYSLGLEKQALVFVAQQFSSRFY